MENLERINAEIEKLIDENSSSQEDFLKKMQELFEACLEYITDEEFDIDTFYETLPVKLQKDFRFLKTLYVYYLGSYKYDKKFDEEDTDAAAIEANAYGEKDESDISENEENEQGFSAARIYPQLFEFRKILKEKCGINILVNLEKLEPKISENSQKYYEQILEKLHNINDKNGKDIAYYITRIKPVVIKSEIIYEVSFTPINNKDKTNRIVAFTKDKINDNYAVRAVIKFDNIIVEEKEMPVNIITKCKTNIRDVEFRDFAAIIKPDISSLVNKKDCGKVINDYINEYGVSLFDIVKFSDEKYEYFKNSIKDKVELINNKSNREKIETNFLDEILDKCRIKLNSGSTEESIILSYLLYTMRYNAMNNAKKYDKMKGTADLNLDIRFNKFVTAPFSMNPPGIGGRTKLVDLLQCLNPKGKEDEFLYNRLKENTDSFGILYTDEKYLREFKNFELEDLKNKFNGKKIIDYVKQNFEKINDKKEIPILIRSYDKKYFIESNENDIVKIIKKLQVLIQKGGVADYESNAKKWIDDNKNSGLCLDEKDKNGNKNCSDEKQEILQYLFSKSKVVFIYGSAGTGKTTLLNYISQFYDNETQLFLAHTGSAVQNLRANIDNAKNNSMTLSLFLLDIINTKTKPWSNDSYYCQEYDLIFIDECSMVSNEQMIDFLNKAKFDKLILVGDDYQIDAIQYGSWFDMVKFFLPIKKENIQDSICQFELTDTFRAEEETLLDFYKIVRQAKINKIMDDKNEEKSKLPREQIREILKKNFEENNKKIEHKVGVKFFDLIQHRKEIFESNDEDEIILCLNYDGIDGINSMNMFLQNTKNTRKDFVEIDGLIYKVDDPIVFISGNRFRKDLHNNLKGIIKAIDDKTDNDKIWFEIEVNKVIDKVDKKYESELILVKNDKNKGISLVKFSQKKSYTDDDENAKDIPFALAYAVSIHKSQGLGYKSVKVVIPDEAKNLITHNIFYTAITRAKKYLEIYCSKETMEHIIDNFGRDSIKADAAMLINRGKLEFCY